MFAFDLDGTITREELLPRIAALAGKGRDISELTALTLSGAIPFAESLRLRVRMLERIPIADIHACVDRVELDPHIAAFIAARRDDCVIVTGNLDIWVAPLLERLGCRFFSSQGVFVAGRSRLLRVLDKGQAAINLRQEGRFVVAIGESVNDEAFFEQADLGIAFAGVHAPSPGLLRQAACVAKNGRHLCFLLSLSSLFKSGRDNSTREVLQCGGC